MTRLLVSVLVLTGGILGCKKVKPESAASNQATPAQQDALQYDTAVRERVQRELTNIRAMIAADLATLDQALLDGEVTSDDKTSQPEGLPELNNAPRALYEHYMYASDASVGLTTIGWGAPMNQAHLMDLTGDLGKRFHAEVRALQGADAAALLSRLNIERTYFQRRVEQVATEIVATNDSSSPGPNSTLAGLVRDYARRYVLSPAP